MAIFTQVLLIALGVLAAECTLPYMGMGGMGGMGMNGMGGMGMNGMGPMGFWPSMMGMFPGMMGYKEDAKDEKPNLAAPASSGPIDKLASADSKMPSATEIKAFSDLAANVQKNERMRNIEGDASGLAANLRKNERMRNIEGDASGLAANLRKTRRVIDTQEDFEY